MKAKRKRKNEDWKPRVRVTMSTGTQWHKSVKDYSRKNKFKNNSYSE